jgi:hypothetical protein
MPTGGRKTKFEVQQLNEASFSLAGLFITLMESAMVDKYSLRLPNLLQYYSMPSNKKTGKKQFKFITIENTKLSNGKIGKKMIQIVDSKADVPQPVKLADMANDETPEDFDPETSTIEPIVLSREYLLNSEYEHEVIIVPNSSIKQSEAEKANKDIAFYQATFKDPQFDQEQNKKDFARAFGKDESIVKPTPEPSQDPLAAMMGGGQTPQPAVAQPGGGQMPNIDMEQL